MSDDTEEEDEDDDEDDDDDMDDAGDANVATPEQYFDVRTKEIKEARSEQDGWIRCCEELATKLRMKPTLPASYENNNISWTDVETGMRIPLYSCPFLECRFASWNARNFCYI